METTRRLPPKESYPPLPTKRKRITTVRGPLLCVAVGVVALVLIGGYGLNVRSQLRKQEQRAAPVAPEVKIPVTQPPQAAFPKNYAEAFKPVPELPPQTTRAQGPPDVPPEIPATPTPPITPPTQPTQTATIPPTPVRTIVREQPAAPQHPKPPAKHWIMGGGEQPVGTSPFGEEKEEKSGAEKAAKKSPLLKEANWIRPADPTQVLYRGQPIFAQLLSAVTSDIPQSDVRLFVTRPVMDRWASRVLLPQGSTMVGTTQAAAPKFGEVRVTFLIEQLHFPNGDILDLGKAKLGDASGQAGLTGDVNNHIGKLVLGSVLSATLSVGARAPFGSQQGFSENLPQQYAGQVGQSVGQSGQQVIQQRFGAIPPTITIKAGEDVTVVLDSNLSLMTPPTVVR